MWKVMVSRPAPVVLALLLAVLLQLHSGTESTDAGKGQQTPPPMPVTGVNGKTLAKHFIGTEQQPRDGLYLTAARGAADEGMRRSLLNPGTSNQYRRSQLENYLSRVYSSRLDGNTVKEAAHRTNLLEGRGHNRLDNRGRQKYTPHNTLILTSPNTFARQLSTDGKTKPDYLNDPSKQTLVRSGSIVPQVNYRLKSGKVDLILPPGSSSPVTREKVIMGVNKQDGIVAHFQSSQSYFKAKPHEVSPRLSPLKSQFVPAPIALEAAASSSAIQKIPPLSLPPSAIPFGAPPAGTQGRGSPHPPSGQRPSLFGNGHNSRAVSRVTGQSRPTQVSKLGSPSGAGAQVPSIGGLSLSGGQYTLGVSGRNSLLPSTNKQATLRGALSRRNSITPPQGVGASQVGGVSKYNNLLPSTSAKRGPTSDLGGQPKRQALSPSRGEHISLVAGQSRRNSLTTLIPSSARSPSASASNRNSLPTSWSSSSSASSSRPRSPSPGSPTSFAGGPMRRTGSLGPSVRSHPYASLGSGSFRAAGGRDGQQRRSAGAGLRGLGSFGVGVKAGSTGGSVSRSSKRS